MNIFVGNLPFSATEGDVKKLFEGFGSVASARIVMEKKGVKSRGFGFVQMPDEQQAQAAIDALNSREFMGRPLNVSPARPKPEVERAKGEEKEIRSEINVKGRERFKKEREQKDAWYKPVFNPSQKSPGFSPRGSTKKRGRYKTGRRSLSYMKRIAASGIAEVAVPKQESRENPMRWRKNYEQPKPWQKSRGERKPWKKVEGEFRPWGKRPGEHEPFKRKESEFKSGKKTEGKPEGWKRKEGEFKPGKKTEGKPEGWKRKEGEFKPWKKSARSESKPWRSSGKRPRPRQSRIESRRKPGGYTR